MIAETRVHAGALPASSAPGIRATALAAAATPALVALAGAHPSIKVAAIVAQAVSAAVADASSGRGEEETPSTHHRDHVFAAVRHLQHP